MTFYIATPSLTLLCPALARCRPTQLLERPQIQSLLPRRLQALLARLLPCDRSVGVTATVLAAVAQRLAPPPAAPAAARSGNCRRTFDRACDTPTSAA